MLLTVAICTWNRAQLLRQTLECMTTLAAPGSNAWELLIVNNNSDDSTDDVIGEFVSRLPIRALWEGAAGLSNARNAAVSSAYGDYIIWTDDDVLVAPNWLGAYASAFELHPDAVVFGGPIKPWFNDTPPSWLTEALHEVEPAYAIRDFEFGDVALSAEVMPFGANMAFRTDVLRDYLFDPLLGRMATAMLGGEEEMVIRTLLRNGFQGRWVPDASVRHYIPQERQTVRYLRRFYEGVGATKAGTT